VLKLLLIISPAAIGHSYSPAEFDCPDAVALTNRFPWSFPSVRRRSTGSGSARDRGAGASAAALTKRLLRREIRAQGAASCSDLFRDDLSWRAIRLQCAASIAARQKAGRGLRRWCSIPDHEPQQTRNLLSLLNLSIEDQEPCEE
jgi:hypothetical protein